MKLQESYYQEEDVVFLAKDLLGKVLLTEIDGIKTGGIITETEAYCGSEKGCHAYNNRKTNRTRVMFESGSLAYVYFCYGMHHLFNIVTGKKDCAQAVLIRSVYPTTGLEAILKRRNKTKPDKQLCNGPGKVCQALGITQAHYGINLSGNKIWLEQSDRIIQDNEILTGKRIGIDYAGEDAFLPWRFMYQFNPH